MMTTAVRLSVFRTEVKGCEADLVSSDLILRRQCLQAMQEHKSAELKRIEGALTQLSRWKAALEAEQPLAAQSEKAAVDTPADPNEDAEQDQLSSQRTVAMDLEQLQIDEKQLDTRRREVAHLAQRIEAEEAAIALLAGEALDADSNAKVEHGDEEQTVVRELREAAHQASEVRQKVSDELQHLGSRRALIASSARTLESALGVEDGGSKTTPDAAQARLASLRTEGEHVFACLQSAEVQLQESMEVERLLHERMHLHEESRALDVCMTNLTDSMSHHIDQFRTSLQDDPSTEDRTIIEDFFCEQFRRSPARGFRQYAPGMRLIVRFNDLWIETDVVSSPMDEWHTEHELRKVGGDEATFTLALHPSELVPIFVKVQELSKRLKEEESADAFARSWNWIDGYLRILHGEDSDQYLFLRQAMMARRALLLLDGVDEGGQVRQAIERHIAEVLVPQGHHMVMTSRPAGVNESSFDRTLIHRLQLQPLSDELQAKVIEHRLLASADGADGDGTKAAARVEDLLEYVDCHVPRDADGVRVTSNPLMLSMVISLYELNEGKGMPTSVWQLYELASSTMLQRLDRTGRGDIDKVATAAATHQMPQIVEAAFFQAHAAQARVIMDEHLQAAAVSLHSPAELAEMQSGNISTLEAADGGALIADEHERLEASFRNPKAVRNRIARACDGLPEDILALVRTVRDRVCQDRLPLLTLLQSDPLQMQSSHLSFQEFYAARALQSGAFLLPPAASEPWRWSAWWSNTLRLGAEMGASFAHGLLASLGSASTSRIEHGLDIRARIAGDRPTALQAIGILLKIMQAADLRDNRFESLSDVQELAQVIREAGSSCVHLSLAGNAFGVEGVEELCSVLPIGVKHLDFSRTMHCREHDHESAAGIEAIFASSCTSQSLLSLVLQRNRLSDTDGLAIAKALADGRAPHLTTLDVSRNQLGVQTAKALEFSMPACKSLATLKLQDNAFTVDGGSAIAVAIARCKALTCLDLSGNRLCTTPDTREFSVEAIGAIASSVGSPTSNVCVFLLARNELCNVARHFINGKWRYLGSYSTDAVQAIVVGLQRRGMGADMPTLQVDVSGNFIHSDDLKLITAAISHEPAPGEEDANLDDIDEVASPPKIQTSGGGDASPEHTGAKADQAQMHAKADHAVEKEAREHAAAVAKAAEEAAMKAQDAMLARGQAAAKAKAEQEAQERFAAESKATAEADAIARAEARAADEAKAKRRTLVGEAMLEAIARCSDAVKVVPPTPVDEGLLMAYVECVVKSTSKSDSEKVGVVPEGTAIECLETRELEDGTSKALVQLLDANEPFGWVAVKTADGKPTLVSLPLLVSPTDAGRIQVVARAEANPKAEERRKVPRGSLVHVLETVTKEDGTMWALISLQNTGMAEAGWIVHHSKDGAAQLVPPEATAEPAAGGKGGGQAMAVGKGAATRRQAVGTHDPSLSAATAAAAAIVGGKMLQIQHKRLANVRNNNDQCPVRQRHDGPSRHMTEHEGLRALIFNCYRAKFEVAEGDVDGLPTSSSYNLVAASGTVIGSVGVADKKGVDFKDRVKMKNVWLPGHAHGLYHPSDQGDASLEVTFEYKVDADVHRVCLLVSPWLSYSCSVGARFLLKKPGEPEGKCATVQRLLGDDRCAMRVDGDSKETLFDPRPDTAIPAVLARHEPGTHLLFLAGSSCVDAVVEEMPEEDWLKGSRRRQRGYRLPEAALGSRHWIRVLTEGHSLHDKVIEADLNQCNHCVQRFNTVAAYEQARLLHCADIITRERHVDDAITGNTLDIAEQVTRCPAALRA